MTLDEEHLGILSMLAEKKNTSVSAIARDLIARAVELDEDYFLAKLADKRLEDKDDERISHEDAWDPTA